MPARLATNALMSVDWDPHPAIVATQFFAAGAAFRGGWRNELEQVVKETVIPAIGNTFDQEGIPSWAPLAESTLMKRSKAGTGSRILQETGTLREVATSLRPWSFQDNEAYLLASSLGEAYYGVYHEFGTRNMPVRSWATMPPRQEEQIEDTIGNAAVIKILKYVTVATIAGAAAAGIAGAALGAVVGGLKRLVR